MKIPTDQPRDQKTKVEPIRKLKDVGNANEDIGYIAHKAP